MKKSLAGYSSWDYWVRHDWETNTFIFIILKSLLIEWKNDLSIFSFNSQNVNFGEHEIQIEIMLII